MVSTRALISNTWVPRRGEERYQPPTHERLRSSPATSRRIGTCWVGATLNEEGNCYSWCTRLNSRAMEASSGDT
jgi:hypothetical protein